MKLLVESVPMCEHNLKELTSKYDGKYCCNECGEKVGKDRTLYGCHECLYIQCGKCRDKFGTNIDIRKKTEKTEGRKLEDHTCKDVSVHYLPIDTVSGYVVHWYVSVAGGVKVSGVVGGADVRVIRDFTSTWYVSGAESERKQQFKQGERVSVVRMGQIGGGERYASVFLPESGVHAFVWSCQLQNFKPVEKLQTVYEYEGGGISMPFSSTTHPGFVALNQKAKERAWVKNYTEKSVPQGTTTKSHEDIMRLCHEFDFTHTYGQTALLDSSVNNCQDFVNWLLDKLEVTNKNVQMEQTTEVVLGGMGAIAMTGALYAADVLVPEIAIPVSLAVGMARAVAK